MSKVRGSGATEVARRTRALDPCPPEVRPVFAFCIAPGWIAQELTSVGATPSTPVCLLPVLWRGAAGPGVRLEVFI